MSCQSFSVDLLLDWIILGLSLKTLQSDQSTLIHVTVIIRAADQSVFSRISSFSVLICPLGVGRCRLSVTGLNDDDVPPCQ